MTKAKVLKTASLILAIVFTLSMFVTGCGGKTEGTAEATQEKTAAAETTAASQESPTKDFVKLSWYMPPSIESRSSEASVMEEINKMIKEKINAEVEFVFIDQGTFDDRMRMKAAAGEEYDLVFTASWRNPLISNVPKGAFMELDELLAKYGTNVMSQVDKRFWASTTFNGKKYAIPNPSAYAQTWGFAFKKDLVEKYNLDYKKISKLQDLEPFFETLKKNEPGIIPLCATTSNTASLLTNLTIDNVIAGIGMDPATEEFIYLMESKEMVDKYKVASDFYKKGYIAKDAATKGDANLEARSGKYAVMSTAGAYSEDGSKATAAYGFPCVESYIGTEFISTSSSTSCCTAISATSKNPERAMMLVDLLYSDKKLFNTACYGLEGQDYKVVSGQGTDNPTVETNKDMTWAIWHPWIGNLFNQWPSNWNSGAALEKMKKDLDTAPVSPMLGFSFNADSVKSEIAQLEKINTDSASLLITGTVADVDKFVTDTMAKMKAAGLDKVKAEMKKQYTEWKAANGK